MEIHPITWVIPIAGVAAIAFAVYLAWDVLRADTGTEAMQEIAGTIFTGPPGDDAADLRNVTVFADGSVDRDVARLTKRPRVHDLRHTHASWMIAQGTDLFVLQRRLGHESITTTTDTYSHLLPDQQRAAAQAAGRALRGLIVS